MPKNRLSRLRKAHGWDRAQLGRHLGVTTRTIYRWESGESGISDLQKARLCDLFGVSLDHLMGRERDFDDDEPYGNGESGVA